MTKKTPSIAVVILNWNGSGLLRRFLPSVLEHSAGASIWVADNQSTDDSLKVLASEFPSVRVVVNSGNLGFAGGYNEALKEIDADIFALVNSDIEVTSGWLEPVLARFQSDPDTAIVQPKIKDYKNKSLFEYAGASGGFLDRFGYPFCRGRVFETVETDNGQFDDERQIFWASGACFFIRSQVYRELGGFDQGFFAHQEEIDLCWRAFNKGYRAYCLPQSVVFHMGGATLSEYHPTKTYLNFRNSLLMLLRNLPAGKILPIIFIRLCLDGIAGVRFLFQGKPDHCWAVVRAHFGFYRRIPKVWSSRTENQRPDYYLVKNLILLYFFKDKHRFDELF